MPNEQQPLKDDLVIVKVSADEAGLLKQAVENCTIKGSDAPIIAKILNKMSSAFKRAVDKQNGH